MRSLTCKSLSWIFLTITLLMGSAYGVINKTPFCQRWHKDFHICAASADWLYMGDPVAKQGAMVFMHKQRQKNQINTFLINEDKTTPDFDSFDNYTEFAKIEFLKRKFKLLEQSKIQDDSITLFKLATPDGKTVFYQAYTLVGKKKITMSCMGPDKDIIEKDCLLFMKNFRPQL